MLLLDEPNISGLRLGIENYSKVFLSVAFIGALTWEFVTDMKFLGVVKNLVLALIFMSFFYEFHTKAVDLSFKASEELLREVSPKNIFLRKWSEVKVKTAQSNSGFIDGIVIPNLNDLLGTALFLLSKVCILILKLIYTTVYYFTFIFAPVTAVLSFLPVSKNSMAGTLTSSLWCILLPFVLVVFLALVGNSIQMPAQNGELAVSSMDQLIWIFGITLLMLLAPSFTFSLIKGTIASTADAVGVKMTGIGAKALVSIPIAYGLAQKILGKGKAKGNFGKNNNFRKYENYNPNSRNNFSNPQSSKSNNKNSFQSSMNEKGGLSSSLTNQTTRKLSEMKSIPQNSKQASADVKSLFASNLLNNEKVKTNVTTSKIPIGSYESKNLQKANKSEPPKGTFHVKPSKNPPRSGHAPAVKTSNLFKQDHLLKRTDIKSRIERIRPSVLNRAILKERRHEI
jgi:hypothetical protein